MTVFKRLHGISFNENETNFTHICMQGWMCVIRYELEWEWQSWKKNRIRMNTMTNSIFYPPDTEDSVDCCLNILLTKKKHVTHTNANRMGHGLRGKNLSGIKELSQPTAAHNLTWNSIATVFVLILSFLCCYLARAIFSTESNKLYNMWKAIKFGDLLHHKLTEHEY